MTLEIGNTANINSRKQSFDHCKVTGETAKAYKFETCDSFGSYLHDYNVSFWLPKSVVEKNIIDEGSYGVSVNLPHWFDLSFNKSVRA